MQTIRHHKPLLILTVPKREISPASRCNDNILTSIQILQFTLLSAIQKQWLRIRLLFQLLLVVCSSEEERHVAAGG